MTEKTVAKASLAAQARKTGQLVNPGVRQSCSWRCRSSGCDGRVAKQACAAFGPDERFEESVPVATNGQTA